MKLFQIEEPEGAPRDADGPGASVGIEVAAASGAVAFAVGGNAELLPGDDGERRIAAPGLTRADQSIDRDALATLLLALRGRAERQLVRPVTHAVIAAAAHDAGAVESAAAAAGLAVLRLMPRANDDAALAAAIAAEELAPRSG